MGSHRKRVRLIDSTLRDGSHALSHQFRREDVARVARGLDEAGVGTIEVSHGDGLGGSSFNYGFSREDELELLSAAAQVVRQARLAVLLLPGIGTKEELAAAYERGARVARIATHCTEADIAIQHIGMAKEMGMEAIGFLMLAHMIGPDELLRQAGHLTVGQGFPLQLPAEGAPVRAEYQHHRLALLRSLLDSRFAGG